MVYNVYGTKQVDDARKVYNNIAAAAPVYHDSYETRKAQVAADSAAANYDKTLREGYQSVYSDRINALAKRYSDNKFEWSPEKSADYQTQKDYYRREGQKAQENVQGAYAANTGGYSNSYAQAAGQRAFGAQMEELASKVPALRNSALQDWNAQQEHTLNQISMLKGFDDSAYARFRDKVSDNYNFMEYYANKYSTSKGLDMSAFSQELQNWQARLSAAQNNLSSIRQLAESQYEHNNLSADTRASIEQQNAQNKAYYDYLMSKVR